MSESHLQDIEELQRFFSSFRISEDNNSDSNSSQTNRSRLRDRLSRTLNSRINIRPNQSNRIQSSRSNQSNNMENVNIPNFVINAIPVYEGDQFTLPLFIAACENFLTSFLDNENLQCQKNQWLLRVIVSKLDGRAKLLIGSREDATSWPRIKELLLQYFSDQRDEDCLARDLMMLKSDSREHPYNFGMRIQDLKGILQTKLRLTIADENTRRIKNQIYDKIALQTYLHGLQGQLGLSVRLQKPDNLEAAMAYVIEEQNYVYGEKQMRSIQSNSLSKPSITPQVNFPFRPLQNVNPLAQSTHNNFANVPSFVSSFSQPTANRNFGQPIANRNPFGMSAMQPFNRPSFNNYSQSQTVAKPNFFQTQSRPNFFQTQSRPNFFQPQSRPNFFQTQPGPIRPQQNVTFSKPNTVRSFKPTPMETSTIYSRNVQRPTQNQPQNRKWVSEELYLQEFNTENQVSDQAEAACSNYDQFYPNDQVYTPESFNDMYTVTYPENDTENYETYTETSYNNQTVSPENNYFTEGNFPQVLNLNEET